MIKYIYDRANVLGKQNKWGCVSWRRDNVTDDRSVVSLVTGSVCCQCATSALPTIVSSHLRMHTVLTVTIMHTLRPRWKISRYFRLTLDMLSSNDQILQSSMTVAAQKQDRFIFCVVARHLHSFGSGKWLMVPENITKDIILNQINIFCIDNVLYFN